MGRTIREKRTTVETPVQQILALDKTVHQPTRLAILTVLQQIKVADYVYLASFPGLSNGYMSTQMAKLHIAGLIDSVRMIRNRKPRSLLWLTPEGRERIRGYWEFMDSIRQRPQSWMQTEGRRSWREHPCRVYGG